MYVLDAFPQTVEPRGQVVPITPWYGKDEDSELKKVMRLFKAVANERAANRTPKMILKALLPRFMGAPGTSQ